MSGQRHCIRLMLSDGELHDLQQAKRSLARGMTYRPALAALIRACPTEPLQPGDLVRCIFHLDLPSGKGKVLCADDQTPSFLWVRDSCSDVARLFNPSNLEKIR